MSIRSNHVPSERTPAPRSLTECTHSAGIVCTHILDCCLPWPRTESPGSAGIRRPSRVRREVVRLPSSPQLHRRSLTCSRLYRQKDHADYESLERNRISNVSFAVCSAGEIVVLAIMVGILKGLKSDESTEINTKAFRVLIAFSGGVWGE